MMRTEYIVKLKRPLQPPKSWRDSETEHLDHVLCFGYEPTDDGEAYRLDQPYADQSWYIPRSVVTDIREPGEYDE